MLAIGSKSFVQSILDGGLQTGGKAGDDPHIVDAVVSGALAQRRVIASMVRVKCPQFPALTRAGRPTGLASRIRAPLPASRARCIDASMPRCRFHDLRHSSATFLIAQGMTLEDVKNQLGHSSITLTSTTYGHVLERRQREVAPALDAVLGG